MPDPYQAGLTILSHRELSTAQVRDRLARRGLDPTSIETAIQQLQRNGALDDSRTARSVAHRSANVSLYGRNRVMRELRNRGISQDISTSVIEEVYSEIDEHDLSERALARRLKGPIESLAEMRRLYQYLIRQGFDGWLAQSILRTHTTQPEVDDDNI